MIITLPTELRPRSPASWSVLYPMGHIHSVTSATLADVAFMISNHLILCLENGSFRLTAKFNLITQVGGRHVVLLIIPAIFISEAKESDKSSPSGEAEDSAQSGDYQGSGESEESGESGESGDFEESGESGDFVESGESGDFVESGESGDFEESGDSGDYEESGESRDSSISKRSEIPTETQKGISHICFFFIWLFGSVFMLRGCRVIAGIFFIMRSVVYNVEFLLRTKKHFHSLQDVM